MKKIWFCVVILSILMTASLAHAFNLGENKFDAGLSLGSFFAGKVYISRFNDDVNSETSLMLKGHVDAYLAPRVIMGMYLNYISPNLKYEVTKDAIYWNGSNYDFMTVTITDKYKVTAVEIGGSLKGLFKISPAIALKPGLSIGYRALKVDKKIPYVKSQDFDGLGINGGIEVQYLYSNSTTFFADIGALSQPVGGNKDVDITFSPIPYVLFGVEF